MVVYINLTDKGGGFANTWFYAAKGIQNQALDVAIAAINGRKDVRSSRHRAPSGKPALYGHQPPLPYRNLSSLELT